MALLWSSCRIFFFAETVALPALLSHLLWWLPFDLQFSTFSLLILFYSSLLYHPAWHSSGQRPLYIALYVLINLTVPFLTVAYAVSSPPTPSPALEVTHHVYMAVQLFALSTVFAYTGLRLHFRPSHPTALLTHAPFPLTLLTALCLPVFISRAVFAVLNAVGLYGIDVVREGEDGGLKEVGPGTFVLLVLWEVAPTTLVLAYFHHIPGKGRGGGGRRWGWWGGRGREECVREDSERSGSPSFTSHLSNGDDLDQDLLYSQQGEHMSRSLSAQAGGSGGGGLNASLLGTTLPASSSMMGLDGPVRSRPSQAAPVSPSLSVLWQPRGGGQGRTFGEEAISFSPPFLPFQSYASPPVASPSPTPSALSSPGAEDPRGYSHAAEKWRSRREGGEGEGTRRVGRSVEDDDDEEYRYSASLDLDT